MGEDLGGDEIGEERLEYKGGPDWARGEKEREIVGILDLRCCCCDPDGDRGGGEEEGKGMKGEDGGRNSL